MSAPQSELAASCGAWRHDLTVTVKTPLRTLLRCQCGERVGYVRNAGGGRFKFDGRAVAYRKGTDEERDARRAIERAEGV